MYIYSVVYVMRQFNCIYVNFFLDKAVRHSYNVDNMQKPVTEISNQKGQSKANRGRCERGIRIFGEWTREGGRKRLFASSNRREPHPLPRRLAFSCDDKADDLSSI